MNKLDDKQIREALISRVSTYKDCKVYEELTVPSGKARADVVAVNGHVVAYEIKSDFDSIIRLDTQIPEYDRNFEMNYIVVGSKYAELIPTIVPDYWGIIVATKTRQNTVRLSFIRRAKLNPNHSFKDFVSLLSSNDIKRIASKDEFLGKKVTKSQIRKLFKQDVIRTLDETLTVRIKSLLKNEVRTHLKNS
jgi:hypothetical protein